SGKAYCITCDKILICKKSQLLKHANTASHIKHFNERHNPSVSLLATHVPNWDHISKVKSAEIKLSAFYAEHDIDFQTIDHLILLLKDICCNSQVIKDLTLSQTKCKQIIKNVIAKVENEKTIKNLQDQKFSVLLVESTNIISDKMLCILVKYVSPNNKKCITELLELVELDATDCSAEKYFIAFENCFNSKNIPLTNIVGVACDNASVMIEIRNSFISRLKKGIPAVILSKCIYHTSALISSTACSKLPDSCENLLHLVTTYICDSTKRSENLREFQQFFKVEIPKLLKLAGTRWLSLRQCVVKLLDNWEVLKKFFSLEVIEIKNKSAEKILELLNNDSIKAYLLFLKYSLLFFNSSNTLYQSRKILIHKLSEICEQLIKQIGQNFLLPAALRDISLNLTQPDNFLPLDKIYVGSECEIFLENQTSEFAKETKLTCLNFYIAATNEMLKCFPFNDSLLRSLKFLDSKFALCRKARNEIKDLTDVAIPFGNFDATALAIEWRSLPSMFSDADRDVLAKLEIDEMWKKIFETKNISDEPMFPNLEKLVHAILSLPHSNAEAERIFSIVQDVQDNKRNRINNENLNAICKIRSSFQAQNINCHNLQVNSRHLNLYNSEILSCSNKPHTSTNQSTDKDKDKDE
ncbi:hypothetical protein ALC62_08056, partial [Cyphomyrmex costatus]